MTWTDLFTLMSWQDGLAVGATFLAWLGIGWRIEHPGAKRPSVTVLMGTYRRIWMHEMRHRENRIFDSQILMGLRQGTTFFASTTLLAIGGVLAVMGNISQLEGVAEGLTQNDQPAVVWQIKLMLPTVFLLIGFLKFVWASRVFGYCAVMISAVPNAASDPIGPTRADMAADLNIRAAANFNRGLRAMYFALGSLAWLVGPLALGGACVAVLWLLYTREFTSISREVLLREPNPDLPGDSQA